MRFASDDDEGGGDAVRFGEDMLEANEAVGEQQRRRPREYAC